MYRRRFPRRQLSVISFLTGNDVSTHVSKLYEQDLEPERLQLQRGMLTDTVSQRKAPVKTFQDDVEMLSGDNGE